MFSPLSNVVTIIHAAPTLSYFFLLSLRILHSYFHQNLFLWAELTVESTRFHHQFSLQNISTLLCSSLHHTKPPLLLLLIASFQLSYKGKETEEDAQKKYWRRMEIETFPME